MDAAAAAGGAAAGAAAGSTLRGLGTPQNITYRIAEEVQQELGRRLYVWAISDVNQDRRDLALARRFPSTGMSSLLEHLDGLHPATQDVFLRAMCKRQYAFFKVPGVPALSGEEQKVVDDFLHRPAIGSRRARELRGDIVDTDEAETHFAITCILLKRAGRIPEGSPLPRFRESILQLANEMVARGDLSWFKERIRTRTAEEQEAWARQQLKLFRINKRILRALVKERLKSLFDKPPKPEGAELDYEQRVGPWVVVTSIDFGGRYQMRYRHDVLAKEEREVTTRGGMRVAFGPELLRFLNLGSWSGLIHSDWNMMTSEAQEEQLEGAAELLRTCCQKFLEKVDHLLSDLPATILQVNVE